MGGEGALMPRYSEQAAAARILELEYCLSAVNAALAGEPVSDFALSIPTVRAIADALATAQAECEGLRQERDALQRGVISVLRAENARLREALEQIQQTSTDLHIAVTDAVKALVEQTQSALRPSGGVEP
jgi:hypothetical protein